MTDVTTLLAGIKTRATDVVSAQNTRTELTMLDACVYRSQSDVPRLVAALEAVAGLADDLDCRAFDVRFSNPMFAGTARETATRIRAAVVAALGGGE